MQLAFLNAALETGIENPLDRAIVATGKQRNLVTDGWRKVDEIPYDFQRKRLTIVVDEGQASSRLIITKGAFNEMMSVCTMFAHEGVQATLDVPARAALEARYRDYGLGGQRALVLATRRTPVKEEFTRADERDMVFAGFLIFVDPPKPDAKATLAALAAAGVKVKVITGDNRYVAGHVAELMGLNTVGLLCGENLDALKGDALLPIVERADIFAEIDPQQKERIVKALQKNGHAVAFLGDGVNDAPALHAADVGISVEGAVDVAREAADVILLERDLGVLKQGIEDGRRTFANTMKYICINTGSCFGNMVSMAVATPFLPFLPLTATQVLLTNFLTDLPLMAITTDGVDIERVESPQRLRIHDVQTFMIVFGLLSSVFDLATFFLLSRVFHASAATFQTTWFVVSVLTELLALFVLRTQRPIWKSSPGRWIVWLSVLVAAITIAAPAITPIATMLRMKLAPAGMIAAALAIVVAYAGATEAVKGIFYRRVRRD
jgi:Mg2+-importing ATPase